MIVRAFVIGFMVGVFNGILVWVRERLSGHYTPS
jgi:ribose/xylose/arabinose/galactoside ABC-type transport system permease subunit